MLGCKVTVYRPLQPKLLKPIFMSKKFSKKTFKQNCSYFSNFFNRKFLTTASFQSHCIPFFLQLRSWIKDFQFISYPLHCWSCPRLSLQASLQQAMKHTVLYKHDLFVTPSRIWKLSDAHFAKKSTKAVDINLTTIKHNLRIEFNIFKKKKMHFI